MRALFRLEFLDNREALKGFKQGNVNFGLFSRGITRMAERHGRLEPRWGT